jgi:PAS domain S-box-containing protein
MESAHSFRELADSTPVLIWRAGPDKLYNYFNRTWLSFRGRSMDQEIGYGWLEGVHPDDVERCMTVFVTAFTNRHDFSMDYRLRRHDGEFRWMLDTGRPLVLADGSFAGYLGSCLDITDRKEAEVRAARSLADARRAIRQRDVLLAEVHHRVKNNLQVILSLLTLQGRHIVDESCRGALDTVGRRIQALAIVQQELHEDPDVSMIGVLDYIGRLVRPLSSLHGNPKVDTEVEGDNVPIGLTIASVIGMMMSEILANAFAHGIGSRAGQVRISVRQRRGDGPLITVEDSGAGRDATAPDGLGILLVRNLARQVGITALLRPGPGARWELSLPASALAADDPGA